MQLYFIRHAESTNNHLYASSGSWVGRSEDPELTERGQRQAAILADFLPRSGFDLNHLYTSPMLRAASTALMAAKSLGLPLRAWLDLHEGGGIYNYDTAYIRSGMEESELPKIGLPGKGRQELLERFPGLILGEEFTEKGWWNKPFEERLQRLERGQRVLRDLIALHGGSRDRVAFFSHAGFHNHFLRALLKLPFTTSIWFNLNNCAITCLDFGELDPADQDAQIGETSLLFLNRLEFLPPDLIT